MRVLVVGAGFSGIGAAVALRRAGVDDVVVLERGHTVGGTWRDNTYPGAACDVPSQLYSFSFALEPGWTRSFSPQAEIEAYLERVAREHGVLEQLVVDCEVTSARWDTAARHWAVETSQGRWTADVLVSAVGSLSEPRLPDIPGIGSFAGQVVHSARWGPAGRLAGRRVAVVGTGASAIQLVPAIAGEAAHVDVYQRTPPWVLPRRDKATSPVLRRLFRRVPALQRLARAGVFLTLETQVLGLTRDPRFMLPLQAVARRHLARQVADPALRERLTPTWRMGCKRILLSDEWYPSLQRPDVELVTDGIAEIRPDAVVSRTGAVREVDTLVLATGFRVVDSPAFERFHGADGRSLVEVWRESGMQAYKGATVVGFPNFFMLVGPNTGQGHTSMVLMIESQVAYLVDALRTMTAHGLDTVEVRRETQDAWNAWLQTRMRRTVWTTGGCVSWYLDEQGRNPTLWPGSTMLFRRLLARFDLAAYRSTAREDRVPSDEVEVVA